MVKDTAGFFAELKGKEIAVIGIGVSHRPLLNLLAAKGLSVTAYDKRSRDALGDVCGELEALGIKLVAGEDYLAKLSGDVIFRSPGVNWRTPELIEARNNGAVVTSEMELFMKLCPCRTVAVTGSDGKTTTTTIISEFLKAQGKTVHLGGNIGKPLLPEIESVKPDDWAVVELSSFQLISMRQSPDIAVITNIEPNHLDVHGTMEEYIDAKRNILLHQDGFGKAVLNADNKTTSALVSDVRGSLDTFSRHHSVKRGAWLDREGIIWYASNDSQSFVMDSREIKLPGLHNVENYLTAISAMWGIVSAENMVKVAKEFGGVEHRIEFVREIEGVKFYNDSIATSPTRTIAGLNSFNKKIIIIAGGYDKKIPYEPLAPYIVEKVKTLVLMGATADKIETAVRACPGFENSGLRIIKADNMQDAVFKARKEAIYGDVVSLSPASASFDKYPNFEARGKHYKEIVNRLV